MLGCSASPGWSWTTVSVTTYSTQRTADEFEVWVTQMEFSYLKIILFPGTRRTIARKFTIFPSCCFSVFPLVHAGYD